MTVPTTTVKVDYTGDGSTTEFPVTFQFYVDTDLEVIERTIATGAEETLTLTTDYTVVGGSGSTGTVTAVAAPADTVQWIISLELPKTQGSDLPVAGPLPSGTIEEMVDRSVLLIQQLQEQVDRSLIWPKSDDASLDSELPNSVDRASKFLAFNAESEPIAVTSSVDGVPVSDYMVTVLDDEDADAARETLGALGEVIEDTTPQLGGPLDTNGKLIQLSLGAAITAASSCDIWANDDGNTVHVAGNTNIDDFATAPRAGAHMWVIFDGTPTVNDSATITVDGNTNRTMKANDLAQVIALTTTTVLFKIFRNAAETKEFFVLVANNGAPQATSNTYQTAVGDYTLNNSPNAEKAWFVFHVPADFNSLSSIIVSMLPDATETIQFDISTHFAAVGEAYNTHTDSITDQQEAATQDQWLDSDISAAFSGLAAGDRVGVQMTSNISSLRTFGLIVKYT